ncbi:hypothetical protein ACQP1G_20865 [Nocardia sp. CA-107356]|uniref:hypothetical protein n=1 Tax=Nocardia sp. CA-107356 TaxID=3239972 RepID=UPI003D8E8618
MRDLFAQLVEFARRQRIWDHPAQTDDRQHCLGREFAEHRVDDAGQFGERHRLGGGVTGDCLDDPFEHLDRLVEAFCILRRDMQISANTSDLRIWGAAYCSSWLGSCCGAPVWGDGFGFGWIRLWWNGFAVFIAFDLEARHFAFDDAGVDASAAGRQQVAGDLAQSLGQRSGQVVRGKNPPARSPAGARGGCCG